MNLLRASLVAAGAISIASANELYCQAPVRIPPVEVVATRFPEAPENVPASIEVISGEQLRARGVKTLPEALALSAGVAIAKGGDSGPASSVPEFWGLREFDAFLLVVDNVPWGGALNPAISTASLRDVERIEILRGPAPVTFGATSFVGVIHIVHNSAAASSRYLDVSGGTYGSGSVAVDMPLKFSPTWDSRLSADFEREGFKDDNTAYSRGHALWRGARSIGENRMWFTGDLNILRQDPASPHPRQGTVLSTATPLDANYNPDGAFLNENRVAVAAGMERPLFGNAAWSTMASFTFSGQEIFRGFLTSISNTANNASGFRENIDIKDLYADTHLVFPRGSNLKFLAGADLLFAGGEGEGATFTYTAPLTAGTRPAVTEPTTFDKDSEDERLFGGVYGSAEWQPVPRLSLSGGLRLNATSEKRGEGAETTDTRLSGSLGAIFGLWEEGSDHLRVFGNIRDTFKPAAFDFGLAENEGVLDPETSRSFEAGVKARTWGGRLDFEASAFRMNFENLVTATIVNNQPALINSGTTRFQGYELASELELPRSMFVRGTYSFHDGKFVDFIQDFGGTLTQLGGKRFEMSARHLASGGIVYAPALGLNANIVFNHTGDRFLNKRNTALAEPFTTYDAGVGYRADRFEVRLDGHNLSDRRDAVAESEFGDAQYYRMPARTVRATFSLRY